MKNIVLELFSCLFTYWESNMSAFYTDSDNTWQIVDSCTNVPCLRWSSLAGSELGTAQPQLVLLSFFIKCKSLGSQCLSIMLQTFYKILIIMIMMRWIFCMIRGNLCQKLLPGKLYCWILTQISQRISSFLLFPCDVNEPKDRWLVSLVCFSMSGFYIKLKNKKGKIVVQKHLN